MLNKLLTCSQSGWRSHFCSLTIVLSISSKIWTTCTQLHKGLWYKNSEARSWYCLLLGTVYCLYKMLYLSYEHLEQPEPPHTFSSSFHSFSSGSWVSEVTSQKWPFYPLQTTKKAVKVQRCREIQQQAGR